MRLDYSSLFILLSLSSYATTPSFNDIGPRDTYTGRGFCVLSPWNESSCKYSILQLNLGYNPISILEVVSALNINNISDACLHYSSNRTSKYNPKVYLSFINSVAAGAKEDTPYTPSNGWPESYQQIKRTLSFDKVLNIFNLRRSKIHR